MELFNIPKSVQTRWASPENYDALPGEAGKTLSGRKGSPSRPFAAGETFVMAHAEGSGTIRRIWTTISDRSYYTLRGLVIRMYWDGEDKPAVEAPFGDFFCQPLGKAVKFENAWFDNPEGRSFNCRIPMPFRKGFKITVTNESPNNMRMIFYDINFTLGDEHGPEMGYFHTHYRRENPTTLRRDFEILPKVEGRGRFLGCCIGAIADTESWGKSWWGEGEIKAFLDGDTDYPTLCGTGTEDYIATGWGQDYYSHEWHGCQLADKENFRYGFYRLHGPDPIYFQKEARVTIQQIGCGGFQQMAEHMRAKGIESVVKCGDGTEVFTVADIEAMTYPCFLFERTDDWSSVAYFYLDRPTNSLPAIEPYEARIAGLEMEPKDDKRTDV